MAVPAGVRQLVVRHSDCAPTEIDDEHGSDSDSLERISCKVCLVEQRVGKGYFSCRKCIRAVRELHALAGKQDSMDVFEILFDDYPEYGDSTVRAYRSMSTAEHKQFNVRSWLATFQPRDGPCVSGR